MQKKNKYDSPVGQPIFDHQQCPSICLQPNVTTQHLNHAVAMAPSLFSGKIHETNHQRFIEFLWELTTLGAQ